MKVRAGFLLSSATGALLIGVSAISGAMAEPAPVWGAWSWEGYAELGARFFTREQGSATGLNWKNPTPPYTSLGKFYEYRDMRPGPFGGLGIQGLTKDGLYGFDLYAKNIGYRDQSYSLDLSKAGEHYLGLSWDQIPHTYNNHATTIYNGAGTNNLTIPGSVRTTLNGLLNLAPTGAPTWNPWRPDATNAGIAANTINNNLNEFNLGFRRDTASVDYRWTPSSSWDIKADYTRTRREGTQSQGALTYQFSTTTPNQSQERAGRVILELPKPIQDTTHNANLNAEYAGTGLWGKKFNVALGYGLSLYRNDYDSYTFQNPWVTANAAEAPLTNRMSLAPDNSANTIRFTAGADLPWNSRYNGAVNYTMSRQNQGFIPFTSNGLVAGNSCITQPAPGGCTATADPTISASSLNGGNNTLLINNVLTSRLTSDLKSTLRYRYYDFATTQQPITIAGWIYADAVNTAEDTLTSYGMSYKKQNASADLTWTPKRYLTLGAGGGWEQWDRDHRDVNITNEYSGKVFADLKSTEWSRMRTSYIHSERRFDNYIGVVESNVSNGYTTYRLFDMANRNRDKVNFSIDFFNASGVTITPTAGFRFDKYGTDPIVREMGLIRDRAWNIGVDASWKINRDVTLLASYTHEDAQKGIMAANSAGPPALLLDVKAKDTTDTVVIGANAVLVPEKLDVKGTYTYVKTFGSLDQSQGPGMTAPVVATQFPNVDSRFNRLDLQARYRFEPVAAAGGIKTQPYLKLRYLWESNSTNDWSPLSWNYMYSFQGVTSATYAKSIMMGWNNPNYNIQAVMLSYGLTW